MSLVKSKAIQLGFDATPTNNFLIYQPLTPDGTFRIANGNQGATTDIMTVTSGGSVTFAGTTNFSSLNFGAGSQSAPSLFPTGDSNTGIWFPAADTLAVSTGGTERFRISSTGTSSFAGDVGIGTSSPGSALEIKRTAANVGVYVNYNDTNKGRIEAATNGNLYIGTTTGNGAVVIGNTSNPNALYLVSTGDIGIGTTSPSSRVDARITTPTTTNTAAMFGGGDGTKYFSIFQTGPSYNYAGAYVNELWYYGNSNYAAITFGSDGSVPLKFISGGAERLRIATDGKVGIGTNNPLTILDIRGTSASAASTLQIVGNNVSTLLLGQNADGGVIRGQGGNNALTFWTGGTSDMAASGSGTERMRIDSAGNVQIAATANNVGARLFVSNSIMTEYSGTIGMRYNVAGSGNSYFKGMTGTHLYSSSARGLHLFNYDADSNEGICFWPNSVPGTTGTTTPSMKLLPSGILSIGTGSTPVSGKLHVAGAGNANGGNIHMGDNTDAAAKWTYLTGAHYNGATNTTGVAIIGCYSSSGVNSVVIGGSIYEANAATEIQFFTHTAATSTLGGTQCMRIDSSGVLYKNGTSGTARILPASDNVGYIGDDVHRWQAVYAVNGTIQTSDGREKNSITSSDLGLKFINDLRPVSYKWNVGENVVTYEIQEDEDGVEKQVEIVTPRPGVRTHYGLIAQEVRDAIPEGVDFGGFVQEPNDGMMSLRYHEFIAPMIKAIQELAEQNKELQARLDAAGL